MGLPSASNQCLVMVISPSYARVFGTPKQSAYRPLCQPEGIFISPLTVNLRC